MNYTQLTLEERYILGHHKSKETPISQIAKELGRHRTTIWREINRNRCHRTDGAYRPTKAHARAKSRRSRSRRVWQHSKKDWELVEEKLREYWSPEQIAIRFRKQGILDISHETIYRYIWTDKKYGGDLYRVLKAGL